MRRLCLYVCFVISLAWVNGLSAETQPNTNEVNTSVTTGKRIPRIAAMGLGKEGWTYLGDCSMENIQRLADAGVNTFAIWVGYPINKPPLMRWDWWNDPATIREITEVANRCAKVKIDVYLVTFMGMGTDIYPQVKIIPSKDMDGVGDSSPSWFDPVYWEKVLIARDRQLAKLARKGIIKGILLEPEVYGLGALMERGQLDFGDAAYNRFTKAVGMKGGAPEPKDRAKSLLTSGMIGYYFEWQRDELKRFATQWKLALRKEAPDIQLGFYNPGAWHSTWSLRAMAQGMNDEKIPLLILDASTYSGFGKSWTLNWEIHSIPEYSRHVDGIIKDWGINAKNVFGVYTYPHAPSYQNNPMWEKVQNAQGITTFLRETVKTGNGWWIYNEMGDPAKIISHIKDSTTNPDGVSK